jgi:hypothetical protein
MPALNAETTPIDSWLAMIAERGAGPEKAYDVRNDAHAKMPNWRALRAESILLDA